MPFVGDQPSIYECLFDKYCDTATGACINPGVTVAANEKVRHGALINRRIRFFVWGYKELHYERRLSPSIAAYRAAENRSFLTGRPEIVEFFSPYNHPHFI